MCSRETLCRDINCAKCAQTSFASHPKAKFWSDKNTTTPRFIFRSDRTERYFDCDECHHTFKTKPVNITNGDTWCSFCGDKQLCDDVDCKLCHEKSFASHEGSKYWHADNDVTPRQVFKNCNSKFWFQCDNCPHAFDISLNNVNLGRWCKFCCHNGKLCEEDCDYCLKKSFASHDRSKYWSDKNAVTPRQVLITSTKPYWFDCETCGHDFEAVLSSVTSPSKPTWCSYCGDKQLCNDDDCQTCLDKSFASHAMAVYWHRENDKPARQVFKNCNKPYKFSCHRCGIDFEMPVSYVTRKQRPSWCPNCKHKTQQILGEFLRQTYPDRIVRSEVSYDWCIWWKTGTKCRYDFEIPELDLLIELDGPQHFRNVSNWGDYQKTFEKDLFKMTRARTHGKTIIRMLQEDVLYNRMDWKSELRNHIKKYEAPSQIFISQGDEYVNHGAYRKSTDNEFTQTEVNAVLELLSQSGCQL